MSKIHTIIILKFTSNSNNPENIYILSDQSFTLGLDHFNACPTMRNYKGIVSVTNCHSIQFYMGQNCDHPETISTSTTIRISNTLKQNISKSHCQFMHKIDTVIILKFTFITTALFHSLTLLNSVSLSHR